jgi:hypothetical protein
MVIAEPLCVRCAKAPQVYLIRPHPGVGYCSDCWVELINGSAEQVPELNAA